MTSRTMARTGKASVAKGSAVKAKKLTAKGAVVRKARKAAVVKRAKRAVVAKKVRKAAAVKRARKVAVARRKPVKASVAKASAAVANA